MSAFSRYVEEFEENASKHFQITNCECIYLTGYNTCDLNNNFTNNEIVEQNSLFSKSIKNLLTIDSCTDDSSELSLPIFDYQTEILFLSDQDNLIEIDECEKTIEYEYEAITLEEQCISILKSISEKVKERDILNFIIKSQQRNYHKVFQSKTS